MHMYMCVHVCVHMCMFIWMYMYICVSVYMYAYTCIYTRVWVYICTRVGAFCFFSLLHACVSQVFFEHLYAWVGGDWEVGFFHSFFMVSACCWRGRLCFGSGTVRGFILYISLFLRVLR